MAEATRAFTFQKKADGEQAREAEVLKEGLVQTRKLMNQAYAGFNGTGDPDLIESYVFEINALQARYSYLLRRFKEVGGRGEALV